MDEELNHLDQETDLEDAIEAFMKSEPADEDTLSDDKDDTDSEETVEEEVEEEADEGSEEDPEDKSDEDSDDAEEEEEEGDEAPVASDEAVVTVQVDGKDIQVSVKDLKRLYGQEAALTQKSQSLATQRRSIEAQTAYVAKILQDRYASAKANAQRYANVDLFRAARELETEEFEALRSAKEAAESEVKKLEQEGTEFLQQVQTNKTTVLKEQAKEALKVITREIPEWNDETYGKVRSYAVSQGMDTGLVNEIVDPSAIIMMHKAMKYDQVQKSSENVVKKVAKAPKKVVKKGVTSTDTKSSQLKSKRSAALSSGDIDDVADLFMAAMQS